MCARAPAFAGPHTPGMCVDCHTACVRAREPRAHAHVAGCLHLVRYMRDSSSKDDGGGCYQYDFHHVDGGVTKQAQLHARGCPLAALQLKQTPERATSVDNLRSEEEEEEGLSLLVKIEGDPLNSHGSMKV